MFQQHAIQRHWFIGTWVQHNAFEIASYNCQQHCHFQCDWLHLSLFRPCLCNFRAGKQRNPVAAFIIVHQRHIQSSITHNGWHQYSPFVHHAPAEFNQHCGKTFIVTFFIIGVQQFCNVFCRAIIGIAFLHQHFFQIAFLDSHNFAFCTVWIIICQFLHEIFQLTVHFIGSDNLFNFFQHVLQFFVGKRFFVLFHFVIHEGLLLFLISM